MVAMAIVIAQGERIMKKVVAALHLLLCPGLVWAEQRTSSTDKAKTLKALKAEIAALKPSRLAWRGISWKTCLLEGLQESRAKSKPVLLWIFIDRPADDARC
jgi:hypothetical protein